MRRKSDRTAIKKAVSSPEKKVEKVKRTRSKRRKQSSSSGNESADNSISVSKMETVGEIDKKQIPVNEDSLGETQDQVWRVKATEGSGDVGEIQKLKICLTRPLSTPERADRSPRSKRKHSRAMSFSDTSIGELVEDKKKKHRSKRGGRESKDESEKIHDSHGEEVESEVQSNQDQSVSDNIHSDTTQEDTEVETPMSTTKDESKILDKSNIVDSSREVPESTVTEERGKISDADTTVVSPRAEMTIVSPKAETSFPVENQSIDNTSVDSSVCNIIESVDKSEVLEIHAEEKRLESPEKDVGRSQNIREDTTSPKASKDKKVSKTEDNVVSKQEESDSNEIDMASNKTDVVEKLDKDKNPTELRKISSDTNKNEDECGPVQNEDGQVKNEDGQVKNEDGQVKEEDRQVKDQDGQVKDQDRQVKDQDRQVKDQDRQVKDQDRQVKDQDRQVKDQNRQVKDKEGQVIDDREQIANDARQVKDKGERDKDKAGKDKENSNLCKNSEIEIEQRKKSLEHSDSVQSSSQDEIINNGQSAPIVVNRKRRWGSRPTKLTTQKTITISTDILKDIIPDVKPVEFEEVIEEKKHRRVEVSEKIERPVLPKIVIDNTENVEHNRKEHEVKEKDSIKVREPLASNRKISIVKDNDSIISRPPSPPRHKQSCILYITNLVRPFTLAQLKNLLQRTGKIMENGFWIDRIKSKCFVKYETEDQAIETRHALHGVTWPVSNPKTLQVDFSTEEAFDKTKLNEETDNTPVSTIPGTVEDWLREQDLKRERGELEKPWERKAAMREWDVGKNDKEKDKDKDKIRRDEHPLEKRRHRTPERSPEPARKFKKKEEEAPAKLLDDLFRKTKTTPCIYWLPLSAETIAVKEEQRRQHMAEHERRLQELRRPHRRH